MGQDGTGAKFQNPKVDTCFATTNGEARGISLESSLQYIGVLGGNYSVRFHLNPVAGELTRASRTPSLPTPLQWNLTESEGTIHKRSIHPDLVNRRALWSD